MNQRVCNSKFPTLPLRKGGDGFYTHLRWVEKTQVEYKIFLGNQKIVFIKAGAGGNAGGYENKYLTIARQIHKRLGATVICASNPDMPHRELDEEEIRWVIAQAGFSHFEISFVGTSDGAYQNLSLAQAFPQTVKWLGINCSYVTVPCLQQRLLGLPRVDKVMVYGTQDEDAPQVVPALRNFSCDNLTLKLVEGADHRFTSMEEEFFALAEDC